ncbi:Hypothetical protein NTJ_02724 [Nesidiocoris tenuis]|uniref:Uncharacterized protein n=1 Tax=Nesidiocoris tenuis TaxID=355587 RepID=A0ABN7AC92_9HEMI|nr:Hypothetical protein NTJ_02724 [Nesidiocoris tenuis]
MDQSQPPAGGAPQNAVTQLGLRARPAESPLQKSVLEWVRSERLLVYWPFISHLSYEQLVGMRENNLTRLIRQFGDFPITFWAKKRILKSAKLLRYRVRVIESVDVKNMFPTETAERFLSVLKTPISRIHLEPSGRNLAGLVREKLFVAIAWYGDGALKYCKYRMMLESFSSNECFLEEDRCIVAQVLSRQRYNMRPRSDSCPPSFAPNLPRKSPKSMTAASLDCMAIEDKTFNATTPAPIKPPPGFSAPSRPFSARELYTPKPWCASEASYVPERSLSIGFNSVLPQPRMPPYFSPCDYSPAAQPGPIGWEKMPRYCSPSAPTEPTPPPRPITDFYWDNTPRYCSPTAPAEPIRPQCSQPPIDINLYWNNTPLYYSPSGPAEPSRPQRSWRPIDSNLYFENTNPDELVDLFTAFRPL